MWGKCQIGCRSCKSAVILSSQISKYAFICINHLRIVSNIASLKVVLPHFHTMHSVQRVIDLPGVSLETVLVYPKDAVSANDAAKVGASRLAVFCHPWSWLGGRMEDPYVNNSEVVFEPKISP
jgi:hypothetical protein